MKITSTEIVDVLIIEPHVYEDPRGFFLETYQRQRLKEAGLDVEFVQDNHSRSVYGTLRGLHYQLPHPQGKLCRVARGEVFDVAVDVRRDSPTFGQWVGVHLSDENHRQVYVPPGCAHGFCVLSEVADFLYKCTDLYFPEYEQTLIWNDPHLAIEWPIREPLLSAKDRRGVTWDRALTFSGEETSSSGIE